MKTLLLLTMLALGGAAMAQPKSAPPQVDRPEFSDVPRGHWCYQCVSKASEWLVASDEKWKRDVPFMANGRLVTRYEFVAFTARLEDYLESSSQKEVTYDRATMQDVAALLHLEFKDELERIRHRSDPLSSFHLGSRLTAAPRNLQTNLNKPLK